MPSRVPQQPAAVPEEPARLADMPMPDGPPPSLPEFEGSDEDDDFGAHLFTCLGYDHGTFYYLSHGAAQVLAFQEHSKHRLLQLAPLGFWEREFPTKRGADWDSAANRLMRLSERVGVYRPEMVRGRGAWFDDGRHVLHLGDRLVSGRVGEPTTEFKTTSFRSRYIYEAAAPMRLSSPAAVTPLTAREANQLVELSRLLSWARPVDALLLAGWCVVAPICGALKWRPHVWITGPAGSGKSWVYNHLLRRCLGEIAVAVASETTEAGIRQVLRTDARPVLFDEAESETARSASRIQNVLALMRQASSETSARIIKGSALGNAQSFEVRSCFAFSSISVGLAQHADASRVTVLSLTRDQSRTAEEREQHFGSQIAPRFEAVTDAFIDRLHARTISMIPVIRENAETFARAGAAIHGSRRFGDQLGALLAGAVSLHRDGLVTLEQAREFIQRHQWDDEAADDSKDEVLLLKHLMQTMVRVQVPGVTLTRSVGELVTIAVTGRSDEIQQGDADRELQRIGIRVTTVAVCVANRHRYLAENLKDTPWGRNWARILGRLPGASSLTQRFAGVVERCVGVPLETAMPDPE